MIITAQKDKGDKPAFQDCKFSSRRRRVKFWIDYCSLKLMENMVENMVEE